MSRPTSQFNEKGIYRRSPQMQAYEQTPWTFEEMQTLMLTAALQEHAVSREW
jgi:hypothetical protein